MTAAVMEHLIALVDRSIQVSDENARQMRVSFDALTTTVSELRTEIQEDHARGEQVTRDLTEAITELRIFVGRLDERLAATNQRLDNSLSAVSAILQTQAQQIGELVTTTQELSRSNLSLDQRMLRIESALGELATRTDDLSRSIQSLDRRMFRFETVVVVLIAVASLILAALQVFLR